MAITAPGVYVQEVPSGVAPVEGVSTSTAALVGLVNGNVKMPVGQNVAPAGQPQIITNWTEFKDHFGDIQDDNEVLAQAVYGFFNNGGGRCWVTRVTDLTVPPPPTGKGGGKSDDDPPPLVPTDQVKEALAKLEEIDEISLVAVPVPTDLGESGADTPARKTRRAKIREMIVSHCELMGDRFGILDGEETPSALSKAGIYPSGRDSSFAAIYYPWINIGEAAHYPPSGYLAGIYARVDSQRGVFKAPANAAIRGALGVSQRLSREQQGGLNPDGINVIRQFNGNIMVWGARTVGGNVNGEWKYVNVRRTFIFLAESIEQSTRWVVFEPNEPGLWAKITRNITAFLTIQWRAGALLGTTPQEAFFVRCDAATNPPEVRELGQVITEVGVAIVRPAEFVIFRIQQKPETA